MPTGAWTLLLLGGAAASGKSTCGTEIARRLGVFCVSADSLWLALKRVTTPATHPAIHHFEPTDELVSKGPEVLCEMHIETACAVSEALDEFIDAELAEEHSLVLEGAWITPELAAAGMRRSNVVRAVFIYEREVDEILASMAVRSSLATPTALQQTLAPMSLLYGNWLRDGAERRGVPVVTARPKDTLVDRILESA